MGLEHLPIIRGSIIDGKTNCVCSTHPFIHVILRLWREILTQWSIGQSSSCGVWSEKFAIMNYQLVHYLLWNLELLTLNSELQQVRIEAVWTNRYWKKEEIFATQFAIKFFDCDRMHTIGVCTGSKKEEVSTCWMLFVCNQNLRNLLSRPTKKNWQRVTKTATLEKKTFKQFC